MGNIPTENIDDLLAFILSIRKKVRDHDKEGELDTAVSLIELLAKDIAENVLRENDDETEYHDFTQPIEYQLYKHYNSDSEKEINWIEIPCSHVFFDYGALLIDVKRYDDSRAALLKSLECNPANAMAYYELAEIYKATGNMCDDYVAKIKEGFKYAYTPELFAKGIRSLGFYFSEKKQYDTLCARFGLKFDGLF
jgi:tetratricopeptide (TPR) repeat protein